MGTGSDAWANGIWTAGTEVYTAGVDGSFNSVGGATYWKDDTQTELGIGNSRSDGSQITVDGSDVYVSCGSSLNGGLMRAGYWKKGNRVDLSDESAAAWATGIVVVTD